MSPRKAAAATVDPWYDGRGMDASEASVVFGFGYGTSRRIERGLGVFGVADAGAYLRGEYE